MIELGRYVTKKTMKSIAIIFDNFFSFPIVAMSNLRWFSKVFDTDRTYERLEKIHPISFQNLSCSLISNSHNLKENCRIFTSPK